MWYAVELVCASAVVNNDGGAADAVYQFSSRRLRDVWVADGAPSGPGERRAVSARHPLVRRSPRWGRIDGDSAAWRVLAEQRVERTPELARFSAICLYDWGPEHWRWLATAPAHQIVKWAKAMAEASVE